MNIRPAVQHDERGTVLLLVLWVLVAMSLLGISFSAAIRTEVNAARNVIDQKQSYYLARAGIEYAISEVIRSQAASAELQQRREEGLDAVPEVLTGTVQLNLPGGGAEVEILDESGKVNLNTLPASSEGQYSSDLLYNLLIVIGLDAVTADEITDSVLDWIDPDDIPRPNGAENSYYQSLENPYQVKNGFFDVPEELLLVKGVTPEIFYGKKGVTETGERVEFYGLQKYVSTFAVGAQINVNSAPFQVLAALPYLSYDLAVRVYQQRLESPYLDVTDLMQRNPGLSAEVAPILLPGGVGPLGGVGMFTLISTGSLEQSRVVSRIRIVVQINPASPKGYTILYWNEADTEI